MKTCLISWERPWSSFNMNTVQPTVDTFYCVLIVDEVPLIWLTRWGSSMENRFDSTCGNNVVLCQFCRDKLPVCDYLTCHRILCGNVLTWVMLLLLGEYGVWASASLFWDIVKVGCWRNRMWPVWEAALYLTSCLIRLFVPLPTRSGVGRGKGSSAHTEAFDPEHDLRLTVPPGWAGWGMFI